MGIPCLLYYCCGECAWDSKWEPCYYNVYYCACARITSGNPVIIILLLWFVVEFQVESCDYYIIVVVCDGISSGNPVIIILLLWFMLGF